MTSTENPTAPQQLMALGIAASAVAFLGLKVAMAPESEPILIGAGFSIMAIVPLVALLTLAVGTPLFTVLVAFTGLFAGAIQLGALLFGPGSPSTIVLSGVLLAIMVLCVSTLVGFLRRLGI